MAPIATAMQTGMAIAAVHAHRAPVVALFMMDPFNAGDSGTRSAASALSMTHRAGDANCNSPKLSALRWPLLQAELCLKVVDDLK